jgi:hypothetical protein
VIFWKNFYPPTDADSAPMDADKVKSGSMALSAFIGGEKILKTTMAL